MLNKLIESLNQIIELKGNPIYAKEVIEKATEMYNNGWSNLENGRVISSRNNLVGVKNDNMLVIYEMKDFRIRDGILAGNIASTKSENPLSEEQQEIYLAQAIYTRFATIKRA